MKAFFHNVENLLKTEHGYGVSRLPEEILPALSAHTQDMAKTPSGCEIRFVVEGEKATLKFFYDGSDGEDIYAPRLYLYYGNFQGGWRWLDPYTVQNGYNEVVVEVPKNIQKLREIAKQRGDGFSPDVMRLSGMSSRLHFIGIEGARPPKKEELPQSRAFFYGSSITHGSLSQNINTCFAALTARKLNIDYFNKGLAGSCYLEDGVLEYIFSQEVDFFVTEVGTNCFEITAEKDTSGWFEERIEKLLALRRKLAPDKPLFIIDELKFHAAHKVCSQIVKKRIEKENDPLITYIDGHTLLTEDGRSADLLHPSTDGQFGIAENLSKIIRNKLY